MNPSEEALVDLIRVIAKSELHIWQHPTDEELKRLWDERIAKKVAELALDFGDDLR
jgi:hypothetical protein